MGLSLEEAHDTDIVEDCNGIKVAFDQEIHPFTKEVKLDFQQNGLIMLGAGAANGRVTDQAFI